MRIALLSGANPRTATGCPKVRLTKGDWKIRYDGVTDSSFSMTVTSKPFVSQQEDVVKPYVVTDGLAFNLEIASCVQLHFEHKGTEQSICIIAEKV